MTPCFSKSQWRTLPELCLYATELNHRIFASLPSGYRIASAVTVLAADLLDTFGRALYAEFIKASVTGLPDIGGRPASEWSSIVEEPKGSDRLPYATGRPFALKLYRTLLAKFGRPGLVEDGLSEILVRLVRGGIHLRSGASLKEAENYIARACTNAIRDLVRKEQRNREIPLTRNDEDGSDRVIDVEDPESYLRMQLPPSDLRQIFRELVKVNDRAPVIFESLLLGDSQREIAEKLDVTPSYVTKWINRYGPEMKGVIERHFRQAAAPIGN